MLYSHVQLLRTSSPGRSCLPSGIQEWSCGECDSPLDEVSAPAMMLHIGEAHTSSRFFLVHHGSKVLPHPERTENHCFVAAAMVYRMSDFRWSSLHTCMMVNVYRGKFCWWHDVHTEMGHPPQRRAARHLTTLICSQVGFFVGKVQARFV